MWIQDQEKKMDVPFFNVSVPLNCVNRLLKKPCYCKRNFPMTTHVRLLNGLLVGLSVGLLLWEQFLLFKDSILLFLTFMYYSQNVIILPLMLVIRLIII